MADHETPTGFRKYLRPALATSQYLAWISSVIVLGIVSYFLAHYTHSQHLIYEEVIAALYVTFYIPGLFLPFVKSYKGYMAPLGWIFSYLWLTAFIFAAQDYNWHNYANNSPPGVGHHGLKNALESFIFLSFFFNLVNVIIESFLWDKQRFKTTGYRYAKSGPTGQSVDTSATGTGHPAV